MNTTITTGTSISNEVIRILSYMSEMMGTEDRSEHDDVLQALYRMHKLSPKHTVVTCPVSHTNFFYISENCESVFGYDHKYFAEHLKELKNYSSQIHDADLGDLKECLGFFSSFVQNQSPEDFNKIRAVFHYRFRNAAGKYVYLQDDKATLLTGKNKIIHYSLISKMPDEVFFAGVKLEIYKDDKGLKKIFEYKPSSFRNKLSGREKDVVQLIKQGLTTKEIASRLSISHNTVRNIKSKMFAKYNVTNAIELLNMTA